MSLLANLCLAAAVFGVSRLPQDTGEQQTTVLKAAVVYTGAGEVFRPGAVVIQDGKVVAVGGAPAAPLGARVVDLGEAAITPGLVDAACQLGTDHLIGFSEQSSEVLPQLSVADAVDLSSRSFERLAREGVTTVYVTAEAASVIGGQGAVVKTGGALHSRFLEAPLSIKACNGPETYRRASFNRSPFGGALTFHTRRPTTRMGSTWVFRKAFYDARAFAEGGATDADPDAMAVLGDVLEGKVGFRFQARKAHDIYTAQRLCEEFGISHVLEYGQEAFQCLDLLADTGTTVIYGPLRIEADGVLQWDDDTRPCLTTPALLEERGIRYCLTACDGAGEAGLARVAGMALRFGLTLDQTLAAVTSRAADILGIGDRVGTLAAGRDADLVVWNGAPFHDTSKPVLVLIDGRTAYDANGPEDPGTIAH